MSTKSIQQRVKDAMKNLYFIPWSKDRIEAEFVKQLTTQQAEDAQVHKAEVEQLNTRLMGMIESTATKELVYEAVCEQRDEARTERDALARQVELLTKDKVMLDWLESTFTSIGYNIENSSWGVDFEAPYGKTIREAITSAMKGETNE